MNRKHLAMLLMMAPAAAGCRGPATPEPRPAPPASADAHEDEQDVIHLSDDMLRDLRLSTAAVSQRTGPQDVTALGEVAAHQDRYAEVTPPTGGQVVDVLVRDGEQVEAGAPLARLRSGEVARAFADLVSSKARRDLAISNLERKKTLAADKIVPQREAIEAEAAVRSADIDVATATSALRSLGVREGDADERDPSLFVVRSPIPGRIVERRAVLGRHADPDQPLFTVADLSQVWVVVHVFERDAVNVRAGSVAHVMLAALPGQEYDGRVTMLGSRVDPGSRTVAVRVELANPNAVLRPGMSASVRLEVGGAERTVLAVPAAALQRVGERWLAFIPRNEHEYEMRPVGRGRDLGGEVEVVSGLTAGETVVVDGAFLLRAEAEKRRGGADAHGH
jgi:cobalt-zinc-cadmium efflux system membrane fusion protein